MISSSTSQGTSQVAERRSRIVRLSAGRLNWYAAKMMKPAATNISIQKIVL
jgi:hypothetical protein